MNNEDKATRGKEYSRRSLERIRADPERWATYKEAKKRWRLANKDKVNQKSKRWRQRHPDKVRAYKKKEYQKDLSVSRAKNRARYLKYKDEISEQNKRYRVEHREECLAKVRARRAKNPDRFREAQRRHAKANPAMWRLYSIRSRCKARGIICDIDCEWIEVRLKGGVCEMSGIPFDMVGSYSLGRRNPGWPTIDRKDPKGPYTKDNCRLILWWLNRAMIDLGEDYCLNVFRAIFVKRGEIAPQMKAPTRQDRRQASPEQGRAA